MHGFWHGYSDEVLLIIWRNKCVINFLQLFAAFRNANTFGYRNLCESKWESSANVGFSRNTGFEGQSKRKMHRLYKVDLTFLIERFYLEIGTQMSNLVIPLLR